MSKLRLIDILNMISKGELKEGAKLNINEDGYTVKLYFDGELIRFIKSNDIYCFTSVDMNDELEIIETEENTTEKIKELDFYDYDYEDLEDYRTILTITDKLNEVIRVLNKRG